MLQKRNRLRALVALAGLAASMFLAQAALPTAAQAVCNGANNPVTDELVIDEIVYASADPVPNSCNGNGFFQTNYRSHVEGWRTSFWKQDNGDWVGFYGDFDLNDHLAAYYDGNSHSRGQLCVDNGRGSWKCGYGEISTNSSGPTFLHHVVNEGF